MSVLAQIGVVAARRLACYRRLEELRLESGGGQDWDEVAGDVVYEIRWLDGLLSVLWESRRFERCQMGEADVYP